MDDSSFDTGMSKLLSICITGRDDDYMVDFRYRITTTINYIARNLKRVGRLDDVEIVVTDWGSEVPLAQTLPLSPEGGQICRFIYVSPSVIDAVQHGDQDFHTTMSMNAALRRARGKFLMVFAADTLIPPHSLEAILKLLDGKLHLPISPNDTYFLFSRYQVPWQVVVRRPNLDEWDRYLFLHAGEHQREKGSVFSVSKGAGALMMHCSLWHELRGLDEKMGGWGMSDIELGLRATQDHPWVELSSVGVSLFHMGHTPYDGRIGVKQKRRNPHIYHMMLQVNDENWGLGSYELEIQTAQNIRASGDSVESLACTWLDGSAKVESWHQSRHEVLTELTGDEVCDHVRLISKLFLKKYREWGIDTNEIDSLFFLSWYSKYHHPRRYLEFGIGRGYASMVVADACPSVEIYGIDRWEGVLDHGTPLAIAGDILDRRIAHHGYLRFINGDIRTAVQRLRDSFVGSFFFDLALVRGDLLGTDTVKQVSDVLPHLAPGGALVFTCKSPDRFASVWDEIKRGFPQLTYWQCKKHRTGFMLVASLRDDDRKGAMDGSCLFTTGRKRRSLLKRQWRRLYRALKAPGLY